MSTSQDPQDPDNWRAALIISYFDLFTAPDSDPVAARGFPEVGDGWRDLLERACRRIANALAPEPPGALTIVQIKEKFGTLRLYFEDCLPSAIAAAVEEAVALAQARSACTCEVCGNEGRLRDRGGWLATACELHAQGQVISVQPGRENIYVTRSFQDGAFRILRCRRYIRATDSFVDVDPKSLGITE
ncbi:hypothetical protein V1281_005478 [Nitrobacteraceae bacterium AZCC 2161]